MLTVDDNKINMAIAPALALPGDQRRVVIVGCAHGRLRSVAAPHDGLARSAPKQHLWEVKRVTPKRVMVVDDDPPNVRLVTAVLEGNGFIVDSVADP